MPDASFDQHPLDIRRFVMELEDDVIDIANWSITPTAPISASEVLMEGDKSVTQLLVGPLTTTVDRVLSCHLYGESGQQYERSIKIRPVIGESIGPGLSTVYQVIADKDVASGYAGLNSLALLNTAQFPALTGDVTTTQGGVATVIGVGKVTNTMLAGSIAWSKLLGSDVSVLTSQLSGVLLKANTPLTTKGDLLTLDGTTLHRLPVGADGFVLTADAASTYGVKWAAAAGGGGGGVGTVTSVSGTVNQISVANPTDTPVLSFPLGGVTLPGTTTGTFSGNLTGNASGSAGSVAWGTITGTLSGQTDLQSALDLKAPLISPSFTTPALGTPSAGVLTNATGLPVSTGISGLAAGIATFLATPSSANLATAVSDETGSGLLVFATSPTLTTPVLGVAAATSINKIVLTEPATVATLTLAEGSSLITAGAFAITLTSTASTGVTLPTTGTLATLAGSEALTNKSLTATGQIVSTLAGAVSAPMLSITGATYTAGSATTSKPSLLVEPTGATSTGWSALGTLIGANAASGFTGNLIDAQWNGVTEFKVRYDGLITANSAAFQTLSVATGTSTFNQAQISAGAGYYWNGRSALTAPSDGVVVITNNAGTANSGTLRAGIVQVLAAGALSAPALTATGTWITGGSATTTKPHVLIEPTGATSTAWATLGTGLGINAASGFTGNFIDAQLDGVAKFRVNYAGSVTATQLVAPAIHPGTNLELGLGGNNKTSANQFAVQIAGGVGGAYTQTSGSNGALRLTPTYNQASGTAANTDLLINRTETAVGSGAQNLIDLQVGAVSRFKVSNLGAVTLTGNGALSAPAFTATGTWITGGSATTTKPYVLIEPTGATSAAWSTAGTGLGINAASGFTGNLLDLQINGTSIGRVTSTGAVTFSGALTSLSGNMTLGTGDFFTFNTRSRIDSPADGVLRINNNAVNDFNRLQFGGVTSSFPALKRSTVGLIARLADDSADTWMQASQFRATLTTPASATATGVAGTIVWDTGFIYICTATDTWTRVAVATW